MMRIHIISPAPHYYERYNTNATARTLQKNPRQKKNVTYCSLRRNTSRRNCSSQCHASPTAFLNQNANQQRTTQKRLLPPPPPIPPKPQNIYSSTSFNVSPNSMPSPHHAHALASENRKSPHPKSNHRLNPSSPPS